MTASRNAQALRRLEWVVRAMAQPAQVQVSLFPADTMIGDELALDLEEQAIELVEVKDSWTIEQRSAFEELNRYMLQAGSATDTDLWELNDSLFTRVEWSQLRELASGLVKAMGWSALPPERRSVVRYVVR